MDRRDFLKYGALGLAGAIFPEPVSAEPGADLRIIDHPSPKRKTRPNRVSTSYIILHTTEANSSSALQHLTRYGKANYMVDTNGDIYRIMNRLQVSVGAGRSVWGGQTELDNHAINIEFVGYHNQEPTKRQYESGAQLIDELRRPRKWIGDIDVMPHSMVAYGTPNSRNKQPDDFRGRKRCGMIFAREDVRRKIGLGNGPAYDPDVHEGRLIVGDKDLYSTLFGDKIIVASSEHPDELEVILETIERGQSAWYYSGNRYADSTTTYFLRDGRVRRGDELQREGFNFKEVPPETKIAVGYIYGGHVSRERMPVDIAGKRWNFPSTIYRLPDGKIIMGDDINPRAVPPRTLVLFRR